MGGSAGLPFAVTSGGPRRLSTHVVAEKDQSRGYALPIASAGGTPTASNSTTAAAAATAALHSPPPPPSVLPPDSAGITTDYSEGKDQKKGSSPLLGSVKSSFTYGSARERSPRTVFSTLQPPSTGSSQPHVPERLSSDSIRIKSRRGSQQTALITNVEMEALDKLSDVLPDAERSTLLEYLRRANGNDLIAIGDYLQAQSKLEGKQYLR
jgi:hypothetical protein